MAWSRSRHRGPSRSVCPATRPGPSGTAPGWRSPLPAASDRPRSRHRRATAHRARCSRTPRGGFDCIVLDVLLPDGDGFEVCRTLREEEIATPVLFLTARDASPDKLIGLALGDDYVTKPFSIDELVARIRAVRNSTGVAISSSR